ncbi:SprT family zinc-dependent metalloprotease [Prochlorococcus sp. MIT 1307]|uniref:SprT family zinc-dependent metalloprotease n=1 Tax=Prochlorococcus sp. MIT 1307 TaxID=3096219 RepID=UPI002A759D23|nr:SprT family zinc-dependent metalloprotease [Prochlorococcus sp. MIT 1307]
MPLVPLLPLFHYFNREHFEEALTLGSKPMVSVRWSDGRLRKTAGFYRRTQKISDRYRSEIVLSRPLLENLPQSATESTLCHEMIHAWIDLVLGVSESHGPNFHARMDAINSTQKRFHVSVRHKFPVPVDVPKWWAVCPSCSNRFPYKRLLRGAACKQCCNTYHGGNWHPSCLLSYEPASNEG